MHDISHAVAAEKNNEPAALFALVDEIRVLDATMRDNANVPPELLEHWLASRQSLVMGISQSTENFQLSRAALLALASPSNRPSDPLLELTRQSQPPPYVNWAAAVCWRRSNGQAALAACRAEYQAYPEHHAVLTTAISICMAYNFPDQLRQILSEESGRAAMLPQQAAEIAWTLGNLGEWALLVGQEMILSWDIALAAVACPWLLYVGNDH